jgi:heat shock protein HtpX
VTETRTSASASPFAIDQERARRNRRRAGALVGGVAVVPAVVAFAVATVVMGPIVAIGPAAVLGLLVALLLWRAAPGFTLRRLGALVPADPVGQARLHNLVEGLCPRIGLPKPRLLILDDPAPNTLSVGLSPSSASLVVTTGLLEKLSRIELEGIIGHELVHIRVADSVVSAAVALVVAPLVPVAPTLAGRVAEGVVADREGRADLGAIGLTRYPPGLASALRKIRDDPVRAEPHRPGIDRLWNFPPESRPGDGHGTGSSFLDLRIEALLEL